MQFSLISQWPDRNFACYTCGTKQSVKYMTSVGGTVIYLCNKCVTNTKHLKEAIMESPSLSDMNKLKGVFDLSKKELKANDPQLYYAILAVLDAAK